MHSQDDIQYALETTRILHEPDRRIDTFGTTKFEFTMISELMDTVGAVRVREGEIESGKPLLITPESREGMQFEGFGEQAEQFRQWWDAQGKNFAFLKYGFVIRKFNVREHIVHEPVEDVCDRIVRDAVSRSNPMSAVIAGVDDAWEISLLRFSMDMIEKSQGINIFDFKRRGLL
ncbi:hypothetical protein [Sulfuriroseicoccus oceanibius]|uniref:Uncharacterized protein n=1 Tax=Sulfuriroseicoccus oceanibius TaxID=2707525 RepID=A0A6B3LAI4_9BACT|nr:hypothetical protein [Sulfuriroseicoccus oceanibius]QQL46039.1 hypothetical protein G3M56_005515 [Sulfuriroseicoccus oceanibius]